MMSISPAIIIYRRRSAANNAFSAILGNKGETQPEKLTLAFWQVNPPSPCDWYAVNGHMSMLCLDFPQTDEMRRGWLADFLAC